MTMDTFQEFPVDAAVATVSKDNTFSVDLYWTSQCQHSICSAESWAAGVQYVTIQALAGSGPSSRIILHKQQDTRINIMCLCPEMRSRLKLSKTVKLWSL
ncbi:hypothetical protein JOB18_033126 [Solea senegalensis]|uniref:Uncharacterized protein n=1 Tax=Solea senegalensis TaxID=28829 RepID=A0AAV6QDI2_SOLSE|nr:hypothetical protein JOB18_033126 [Solea senegalensis]